MAMQPELSAVEQTLQIETPRKLSRNSGLHGAREGKNDEFYTQIGDIEKELGRYREHFNGKVVFCNCDDPKWSHFWAYFEANFDYLNLAKLVSTHYAPGGGAYKLEIIRGQDPKGVVMTPLEGDGDFRSDECVEILREADIVVTNPPFSLFRPYVAQLMEHDKKFVILGNMNASTYKEIFNLMVEDRIWFGHSIHSGDREFRVPDHYPLTATGTRIDDHGNKFVRVKGVRWFTNLDFSERHDDLVLYRSYRGNEAAYPEYDNYQAINVDKVADIPEDYFGAMGVPITFLDKHSPDQFTIIGTTDRGGDGRLDHLRKEHPRKDAPVVGGIAKYSRIIIERKVPTTSTPSDQGDKK